ncbi:MAG: glycosyltransferase family 39 protein [Solirubrobacterales bacterium]
MEAATLGGRGPASITQSVRQAARSRSRTFWIVAGLTALAALLRFATLGAQAYHHDEIITASRILRSGFGDAMNAVSYSESAPPLYYALAWVWTQVGGTAEVGLRSLSAVAGVAVVPVAFLIGRELRGRDAGIAAAALTAVNPMLLWYSQEARAYSLLALLCALSLLFCVRAERRGERRDVVLWGVAAGLALATHYFAVFAIVVEVAWLWRRRRELMPGLAILVLAAAALAPLAIHQMSYGHAEWISNSSLGHRLWAAAATFLTGETADIIGRPQRPALAAVPLALALAAFALLALRAGRAERRAAALPLAVGVGAVAVPVGLALLAVDKDYVIARNLMPALVPLLVVVAIAVASPAAGRLGRAVGIALFAYSLGFCVWASWSPDLHRPDWRDVAARLGEPSKPRATVTWTLGRTPLQHYLANGAFQVAPADGYRWLVHEVNVVSEDTAPRPPRRLLGPRFEEASREYADGLVIRRYRLPGPGLAPLRLRALRQARLNFPTNGVLLDGVGLG